MLNKTSSDKGFSWKTSEAKNRNTFYLVTDKLPCVSLLFSYLAPLNHILEGLQNNSVKYLYKCKSNSYSHQPGRQTWKKLPILQRFFFKHHWICVNLHKVFQCIASCFPIRIEIVFNINGLNYNCDVFL